MNGIRIYDSKDPLGYTSRRHTITPSRKTLSILTETKKKKMVAASDKAKFGAGNV